MSDTNLNNASFTPEINDSEESTNKQAYSATGSFRFWCQKVLPLVYDDSLSYYELLCKVVNYLNSVIQNVDNLNTSVDNTNTAFNNLQNYVNSTKDTLIEVYDELEQYVNDYFNNLDVQEEINSKLDSMAEDGSLSTIISPFIPSIVTDWLSKNITPTSPAIDASLSVSGAGADAKVTGDKLTDLKSAILQNGIYDIFVNGIYTDATFKGIQITWSGKTATLTGQATDGNFTSPNIFSNTNAFPENIFAGDIININFSQRTENVYLEIFSYVNGNWTNECMFGSYDTAKYPIPSNATGLLMRLFVYNNKSVNGNVEFSITKSALVKNIEQVIPTVLPGTQGIAETIEALLTQYGNVMLGKGTYILEKPISMPSNSAIRGAGEATVIQAATGADAIVCGASCTIENVKIHSDTGHTGAVGTTVGIRVTGNYDTPPLKYNIKISNVTIDGFTRAGIYGAKTGTWVGDSISAVNCTIFNCYAGLFLEDYSEFGRYTNIMCRDNYIGLYNKSGNNVFENCSFSNNTVGVYLVGDDGDNSRNNGHGTLVGCTINHSNNNDGFAVICRGLNANGFVFVGCQMWYGKIQVEQSTGITFSDCMFGNYDTNTEIINYTANDLFLMNCLFKIGATFSGVGGETHAINCFKFDGTPVTI